MGTFRFPLAYQRARTSANLGQRLLRYALSSLLLACPLLGSGTAAAQSAGAAMNVGVDLTNNPDKTHGGAVVLGDVLTFTETATNTGTVPLTNVSFFGGGQGGTAPCASVAVGASCVRTFTYTVNANDVATGAVFERVHAVATQLPGGAFSENFNVEVLGGPNMTVTEALTHNADQDHSGTVSRGDVLTFKITAVNTGGVTIPSVPLFDSSLAPKASTTCANVAVGARCVLTFNYTVTAADAANGQIADSPYVQIGPSSAPQYYWSGFITVPVKTATGAGMIVTGNVDAWVQSNLQVGSQIRMNVTAVNAGDVPLTNVVVANPLTTPASTTCSSVAVGAACVLTSIYTITAADGTNGFTPALIGSAKSKEVPGPVTFAIFPGGIGVGSGKIVYESLQIVAGNAQTGAPGATLPIPLTIQIQGLYGVSEQAINFTVLYGSGQITKSRVATDAQGKASTQLVLGTTPGAVVVFAQIDGHTPSADFTEIVTGTQPPATLAIVGGAGQILLVNQPSAPMTVQLTRNGAPVPNATITWGGTDVHLANITTLTDASGRSSNVATKQAVGTATVTAMSNSPSFGPAIFTEATAIATTTGLTPAQVAVGHAIDNACTSLTGLTSLTPAQRDLLAQCQALSSTTGSNPGQVANALNQMLPHAALLQTSASVLVTTAQFDNINARMEALRSGGGGEHFSGLAFSTPDGTLPFGTLSDGALGFNEKPGDKKQDASAGFDRWGFFATGTFSDGSADPRQATPGYGFRTDGLTAGVDYRVNDSLIFGVSAGYARYSSNVDDVGGGMDSHGWSLSAYSSLFRKDNWYADGVLTWGSNTYDITRRIIYALTTTTGTESVNQTATSNSGGTTLAAALTLGRDFSKGPWSFGPYLRGTWSRTSFDGYQEALVSNQPGSGLGLAVASRDVKTESSVLGAKVNFASSQSWGVMMPHAEIEWEHEFESSPDSITAHFLQDPTATPFQLGGDSIDTNFFRLGLGLSFQFTHGRSGFVYYEKTLGLTGITQDSIALGFRMEF